MKKIFVLLATRNESDIIESYCRYNLTFCDGMLIYERGSSDNTNEIIKKLISEGLPIYLCDDPNVVFGPFENNINDTMAKRAIDEYGADLVIPLDTDEFLYHVDGINPRETLEALHEDVEYQTLWRTYVYEKEPDIALGFMPNNFTHYRNPILEKVQGHAGKTLVSKYLFREKNVRFFAGAHWLLYPEKHQGSVAIENPIKLVVAHFPMRSKEQIMKKTIPNWLSHWHKSGDFPFHFLNNKHQLGILFNDLKDNGEIVPEKIKKYSIEYSIRNAINNFSEEELEKIEKELENNLTIKSSMDVFFCASKLDLHYTDYREDNKVFIYAILKEIYRTIPFLASESEERARLIHKINLQYNSLVQSNNDITQQHDALVAERNYLAAEREELLNSRSWRFTRPLREVADFIRRHRILRLFAKSLLSIKRNGIIGTVKKILIYKRRYLSLSEIDSLRYDSEYQENIDFSNYEPKVKAIAFYLPQFHRIPENDKWWGKGFTEWTNTRKAKPKFKGHYHPREPHGDIGYYDLTDIDTLKKQVELAKQHCIYGFCFYYYWFSGKRLLEKPLDLLLSHPEIELNFCLCWANENWTRAWDGQDREILMKQNYSSEDPYKFIIDLQKYINDKRYIRVDGIPIIIVYNPGNIPNVRDVFIKWKKYSKEVGIGEIKIWICEIFGHTAEKMFIEDIVDAIVEFPPNNITNHIKVNANIYDYKMLVNEIKKDSIEKYIVPISNEKLIIRTCMAAWDNTARRKSGWITFAGFSLFYFYKWAALLVKEVVKTPESIIFINAWNEWAEGTYLEPDKKYGYANINTFSKAICGLPFKYIETGKIDNIFIQNSKVKICIQIHLFYLDLIDEIIMNLNYMPFPFDCYISTDTDEKIYIIQDRFNNECKNVKNIYVQQFENRGRDVAPFIIQMEKVINKYDFILHIHSKKTLTSNGYGNDWRRYLYKYLLGSIENIYSIFNEFIVNNKLGLIFPETFPSVIPLISWGGDIKQGKINVLYFLKRIGIKMKLGDKPEFPAGNMFWARTKSIQRAFNAGIKQDDFIVENGQVDMTLAHAIERSWVYIVKNEKYTYKRINYE